MIDLIRFNPEKIYFNYSNYIVFGEETDKFVNGCMIIARDVNELRRKLKESDGIIGVASESIKVNREAVMRKKVDFLLDLKRRRIDYSTVKLSAEKDVIIEISLSKFIESKGVERARLFDETKTLFKIIKKFDAPFILTSGANNFYHLRPYRQISDFFKMLGADVKRALYWMERLGRRLFDDRYIMNGLEII